MKIVFIAPNAFGYIQYIIDELKEYEGVEVHFINTSDIHFKYSSIAQRIQNFFSKVIFKKNVKKQHRSDIVLETLRRMGHQDYIVTIRPDLLEREIYTEFRGLSDKSLSFYFDAIYNIPAMASLVSCFDEVYSYEKKDVVTYNLTFCTNYIYERNLSKNQEIKGYIFNVSSYDERITKLEQFALYFKQQAIDYKIIVRKERFLEHDTIIMVQKYITLEQTRSHIMQAQVLLDIQKEHQEGLSFRVFEALGFEKKLITTNQDIVNYDFYHPNNIHVVDIKNPISIPPNFFKTPYVRLSEATLYPYTIEGWVEKVFGIRKTPVQQQ